MERFKRLLEVFRHLGSILELDALLQVVVDAVCDLTHSQHSFILLYEEETDLLKIIAGTHADKELLKRCRVPLQQSIVGKVYTGCIPLVLNGKDSDPHPLRDFEKISGLQINRLLAVPMVFCGQAIGVVEALNKYGGMEYGDDDQLILEALTSHLAAVLLSTLMLDEMQQVYASLDESERKQLDFIAIASHELRTPLGLILGHSADLYEHCPIQEVHSRLDVIYRSAERLKKIVDNFSNISSFQQAPKVKTMHSRVEITNLVRKTAAAFQESAGKKTITLIIDFPVSELYVKGDPDKLSLAFSNLIENAVTYTGENGRVLINAEKLAGYVRISVIDNGMGIPAGDLNKIFDKFYQVEGHLTRRHGGMGVGLSVAKAMIELHEGQIWVESVEGKGSNFTVLLPTLEQYPAAPSGEKAGVVKPFTL